MSNSNEHLDVTGLQVTSLMINSQSKIFALDHQNIPCRVRSETHVYSARLAPSPSRKSCLNSLMDSPFALIRSPPFHYCGELQNLIGCCISQRSRLGANLTFIGGGVPFAVGSLIWVTSKRRKLKFERSGMKREKQSMIVLEH